MNDYILYKGCWICASAPHLWKKLTEEEMLDMLSSQGYMVRNVYDYDCKYQTSFWCIIKDSFGGLEELSLRTRNKVRRALKTMDYKLILPAQLLEDGGYEVMVKSCKGYKVKCKYPSKDEFEKHVMSLTDCQIWGGYMKDSERIVVYSICRVGQDCCNLQTCKCDPSFLRNLQNARPCYPYYGLFYFLSEYYLKQCGLKYIFDGTRTVTEHSNVQNFLEEKFNFRKAYCKFHVRYKPWVKIVVNILYPFRKCKFLPLKVRGVLNMEAMQRGEM